MFVLSVKATRRHILLTALCIAAIIAVLIAGWCFPAERTMMTAVSSVNGSDDAACAAFLRSLGYEAQLPAAEVREIRLPDTFDEALSAYNALQRQAHFDLSGYVGMRVKYRTYRLDDHSSAHVYVYKNHIIGGDITDNTGTVLPLCKATVLPH